MRTKKIFAVVATIGLACCSNAFAKVVYDAETTNAWFHVDMQNLTTADLKITPWTSPEKGDATADNGVIKLDTDVNDPLTYAANPSADVAVVAVTVTATLNADYPEFTSVPQAALTVYCESSETNWVGLVGDGEGDTQWVKFASPVPVVGRSYNVRIEFDQREGLPRQIRYLVDGTVLSAGDGGDGWYPNPQGTTADNIKNVSFSGAGDIAALDGEDIEEVTSISFNTPTEGRGYDYTNGTVSATATILGYKNVTAVLTVSGTDGEEVTVVEREVSQEGDWSWDLNNLTQGGVYAYTIEAKVGGETVATTSGTFTAAKWPEAASTGHSSWFGADASLPEEHREWGGYWDPETKPSVAGETDKYYMVDDGALFSVDDQEPGSNHVTRVDANVTFETLVDLSALETDEDDVLGGFVAAKDGVTSQWMALTKKDEDDKLQWVVLTGDIVPETNVSYVIRAELDFISNLKCVRYLVSTGDVDGVFHPLTPAGATSQWIKLVSQDKGSLEGIELKGSGRIAKFEANVADKALAKVGDDEYDTMEEALDAADDGNTPISLLTNATIDPKKKGTYDIAPGGYSYVSGGKVSTESRTIIVTEPGQPPLVRPSTATMNAVRTPGNRPYKNIDTLREFLENNHVEAYTSGNGDAAAIGTALDASGLNGLPLWQDYVMGIDQTASVTPEYTPSADTDPLNFNLQIPALAAAIKAEKPSGDYAIKYRVDKDGATGEAQPMPETCFIPVVLPSAAASYNVRILLEPTPEPEPTSENE